MQSTISDLSKRQKQNIGEKDITFFLRQSLLFLLTRRGKYKCTSTIINYDEIEKELSN